ncbi:hypothetical protein [Rhizobacter sp. P5_C2]
MNLVLRHLLQYQVPHADGSEARRSGQRQAEEERRLAPLALFFAVRE